MATKPKTAKKTPKKKKKAAKKTKAKMGRPSSFTQELADKLCERIEGGESLIKICLRKDMPSRSAVMRWLNDEKMDDFREQYARAREAQADYHADQIVQISDAKNNDPGAVQRARLRIDARKWLASKQRPKVYGDKLDLEHSIDANTAHILSGGRKRANERKRPKS